VDGLKTSRNTIREVGRRYVDERLKSAINERQGSDAPEKFSGRQKAKITAIACSDPQEGEADGHCVL
jgi:hypothetical protein